MSVYHFCAGYPQRPERALDPLELEIQVAMSCHVGTGNQTETSVLLTTGSSSPGLHPLLRAFLLIEQSTGPGFRLHWWCRGSPGPPLGFWSKRNVLLLPDIFLIRTAIVKLLYPFFTTCFKQGNISLQKVSKRENN